MWIGYLSYLIPILLVFQYFTVSLEQRCGMKRKRLEQIAIEILKTLEFYRRNRNRKKPRIYDICLNQISSNQFYYQFPHRYLYIDQKGLGREREICIQHHIQKRREKTKKKFRNHSGLDRLIIDVRVNLSDLTNTGMQSHEISTPKLETKSKRQANTAR